MKTRVLMIESEKGWGSKIDEVKEFDTPDEAKTFVKTYNEKHNPPGPTPDWYIKARLETPDDPQS